MGNGAAAGSRWGTGGLTWGVRVGGVLGGKVAVVVGAGWDLGFRGVILWAGVVLLVAGAKGARACEEKSGAM